MIVLFTEETRENIYPTKFFDIKILEYLPPLNSYINLDNGSGDYDCLYRILSYGNCQLDIIDMVSFIVYVDQFIDPNVMTFNNPYIILDSDIQHKLDIIQRKQKISDIIDNI